VSYYNDQDAKRFNGNDTPVTAKCGPLAPALTFFRDLARDAIAVDE
jgi:hypothetical protein